jgi:hypothetical protein
MTHDAITITPGHIWATIDVDLGNAQLTASGCADLFNILRDALCAHRIRTFNMWSLSRCLVKVRNIYADDLAQELQDIVDVSSVPRSFYVRETTGNGRERPMKNGRLASVI